MSKTFNLEEYDTIVINDLSLNGSFLTNFQVGVPIGTILPWQDINTIPDGWKLCDGNGTYTDISGITRQIPDLRSKFIIGHDTRDTSFNIDTSGSSFIHEDTDLNTNNPRSQVTLNDTNEDPTDNTTFRRIFYSLAYIIRVSNPNISTDTAGDKIINGDLTATGNLFTNGDLSANGNLYVSNNVGIGTTSPSQKLDVRGNMRLGDGSSTEQDINFVSNVGDWQVGTNTAGNGTDSNQFYIWESAYRLTVQKGTGNVGIGTTSPSSTLDVNGSIRGGYNSDTISYFGRAAIGHATDYSDFATFSHIDRSNSISYAVGQNNSGGTIINSKSGAQGIRFRIDNSGKMQLTDDGSLQVGYNSNVTSYFGRAAIGYAYDHDDSMTLAHVDHNTHYNYAVRQDNQGNTYINSKVNEHIYFRNNNSNKIRFQFGSNARINLGITGSETKVHFWVDPYSGTTAEVNFRNASGQNGCRIKAMQYLNLSDDRMKINEQPLTNATETLMKLKPQLYDEYLSEERMGETRPSVGLIAQEVYYNAPELRDYVVCLPVDNSGNECTPEEVDLSNQDMENDPDYEALGWTKDHYASLSYSSLIPYLIKSNQEQQEKIDALESRLSALENN